MTDIVRGPEMRSDSSSGILEKNLDLKQAKTAEFERIITAKGRNCRVFWEDFPIFEKNG